MIETFKEKKRVLDMVCIELKKAKDSILRGTI